MGGERIAWCAEQELAPGGGGIAPMHEPASWDRSGTIRIAVAPSGSAAQRRLRRKRRLLFQNVRLSMRRQRRLAALRKIASSSAENFIAVRNASTS